jgi:hypothetical protein
MGNFTIRADPASVAVLAVSLLALSRSPALQVAAGATEPAGGASDGKDNAPEVKDKAATA